MKRIYITGLVVFLLVALSGIALFAQSSVDDKGVVNNPANNPRANACFDGGSLAGTCLNLEWKWVCGWGIIRVEKGLLFRETLSAECQALMPVLLPTYTPPPSTKAATAVPVIIKKPL